MISLLVLVATFGAGCWLALVTGRLADITSDMARDAANGAKASARAWVGPTSASLSSAPATGHSIDVVVNYGNTGREPALKVSYWLIPYPTIGTGDEAEADAFWLREEQFATMCEQDETQGNNVAYPTTGAGATYNNAIRLIGTSITDEIVSGKKALILSGCFTYITEGTPHYSAFCFYYRGSVTTNIASLPFCDRGQRAD